MTESGAETPYTVSSMRQPWNMLGDDIDYKEAAKAFTRLKPDISHETCISRHGHLSRFAAEAMEKQDRLKANLAESIKWPFHRQQPVHIECAAQRGVVSKDYLAVRPL